MTRRRAASVAVGVLLLVALTDCSGSSDSSDSDRDGSTTTASQPKGSAWTDQWLPTLVTEYGPAQQGFLTAIEGGAVDKVQLAGQAVVVANAALRTAITEAGPPPAEDAAAAAKLVGGLEAEILLTQAVLTACTGTNSACQDAVTGYAENNKNTIVPAFTALRATR